MCVNHHNESVVKSSRIRMNKQTAVYIAIAIYMEQNEPAYNYLILALRSDTTAMYDAPRLFVSGIPRMTS